MLGAWLYFLEEGANQNQKNMQQSMQRLIEAASAEKHKEGFVIIVICDDFADQGDKVVHSSTNILTSLFVRGSHLGAACWMLTQKQRTISLICRTNFCWLLIWRRRNSNDLFLY